MKIKTVNKSYDEVMTIPIPKHLKPKKPSFFFRTLVRVVSAIDLRKARFTYTGKMPRGEKGPFLVLMNHSSFIDLKIAHKILYPRPFNIVCAHDALIGKKWLMRNLGCVPTRKFVSDIGLVHDMKHILSGGTSVLMYPEAGYSFDGKATVIPAYLGSLVKMLKVPVIFIEAKGAFTRDPLYNELKIRRVKVSAEVKELVTKEELNTLSAEEISERITNAFSFDNFTWQKENNITVTEDFRADGLERVLYKCPHCGKEGRMEGKGTQLICHECKRCYTLTPLGELMAKEGETEFSHIPDWYEWQRAQVREEIINGTYSLDIPVRIGMMRDYKAFYMVGEGRLEHSPEGFRLYGCQGKLDFSQKALASYSLNADFFWYELGDVISIGDSSALYYCFPEAGVPVAKTRLATEELYKLHQDRDFHLKHCGECPHHHHLSQE